AHQIPDDWWPSDADMQWVRDRYEVSIEAIEAEAEGFKTYWGGEGKPKVDWAKTWRNRWIQLEQYGKIRSRSASTADDGARDARANDLAAQLEERRRRDQERDQ